MSRSERVLVTGSGGFTGRPLCAHLVDCGFDVYALTEHAPASRTEGITEIQADLLDRAALAEAVATARPTHVIHLAAIANPAHAQADAVYRVNLNGTLALLEVLAASAFGRQAILLPSTATVYANDSSAAIDESAPLAPGTHYAVSKLAMERMAHLFATRLPIVVVRPFNCTGPGQREPYVVPKIVRHFAQRTASIELGNIDVERDFLDVRTVVDAYRRLLAAPAAIGGTFNVCSESGTSVREIVTHLERITGHRIEVRVNPQFVRAGEPARIVGSSARLRAVIGELALLPLATTLADMVAEYPLN